MEIGRLQYITQGNSESTILGEVEDVLNAGMDWVQLRIKDEVLDIRSIASKVKELCEGKATFILNDYVAIAKELDIDGVHLGLEDMPLQEARNHLGKGKIIGGTANTLADCVNRCADGADYIGLGPFRTTTTKKKLSPILGLEGYQKILSNQRIEIPVVGIGGIQLDDISQLMNETALHGIAVSGLIANSDAKQETVNKIKTELRIMTAI